ncbi:TPA: hypothetical protein ACT191_004062, partial [Raoultella ornithinolytica]
MLNCLGVTGILSESGVVLPLFPQDDCALLVALNVPGPEDDQLVVMINKRSLKPNRAKTYAKCVF